MQLAGGSADLTKKRILAAAELVFSRDGFQGATTREIARQAGVNQSQPRKGLLTMPPTLERGLLEKGHHAPADWRTSRRKGSLRDRLGKRFVPTLGGIRLVRFLTFAALSFFSQTLTSE